MENRRDCQEIISKIIEKIPEDQKEFLKDLKWNYEDAGYKAPEESIQWQRTMETLQKHITQPSESWQWEVLSIFTTRSIDELKSMFKNN